MHTPQILSFIQELKKKYPLTFGADEFYAKENIYGSSGRYGSEGNEVNQSDDEQWSSAA